MSDVQEGSAPIILAKMAHVPERHGVLRGVRAALVAVVAVVGVSGCGITESSGPNSVSSAVRLMDQVREPLAPMPFYVDPTTSSAVAAGQASPRRPELDLIAGTAQAWWVDQQTSVGAAAAAIRSHIDGAAAVGAMPIVALYGIPHRDCGGFAAGGFFSGDQYRSWIGELVKGVASQPVMVIVEPDALTAADCLTPEQRDERMALLRFAVESFAANPHAVVYIDGGHSRWLTPEQLSQRLREVGVDEARGFSLNVSNFFTTEEEAAYGEQVSALLGGAHYVVDTSRNGLGPAPDAPLNWCNPPGRALGVPPTAQTGYPHADAYLWIKRPGESDGDCGRGEAQSGFFMVDYAIELVRNRPR